jgi:putative DNA primase/helicase
VTEPRVIEALRARNALWKGPGHNTHCPGPSHAHGDRNPSLSVTIGADGRALLNCFTGCTVDDVTRALECETADLFVALPSANEPRPKRSKGSVTSETRYPVCDVDGNTVAVKVRLDYSNGTKSYRWETPSGTWHSGTLDVNTLPLFGTERIRAFPSDTVRVICEGEKSAKALLDIGTLALGTVGGAGKCPSASTLALHYGADIVLWADNDAPGQKHMREIAAALRGKAKSIRFIRWDEAPAKGDAADFVAQLVAAGLDDVAIRLRLAGMVSAEAAAAHGLSLTTLDKIDPVPVSWLWTGRIPLGAISVIAGDPGKGKSMLTMEVAARVTVGERIADDAMPNPIRGEVLLLSAEDAPESTIRPRIDAAKGDPSKVHIVNPCPPGPDGPTWITLSDDLDKLDALLAVSPNIRLVVFDPLMAYLGDLDAHKDHELRPVFGRLAHIARLYGVAIVLVAHLNKGSRPAIYRIGGSIAIAAVARIAWLVVEDPEVAERRLLLLLKCNLGGAAGPIAWTRNTDSIGREFLAWNFDPIEDCADSALQKQGTERKQSKRGDAKDLILTLLASGPMPSTEIFKLAKEEGVSRNTCFRAKKEMGVRALRRDDQWWWELPEGSKSAKDPSADGVGELALFFDPEAAGIMRRDTSEGDSLRSDASSTTSDA